MEEKEKGKSIFEIQKDLIGLFNEIESQQGEITEEQQVRLMIGQDELNVKLDQYKDAITKWKSDIEACREEEIRLHERRDVYQNRIDRLKSAMLYCVESFGQEGKTNRFIETQTARYYTKSSTSVELDQTRIIILTGAFSNVVNTLYRDKRLGSVSVNDFIELINEWVYQRYADEIEPFTAYDLESVTYDITAHVSIAYIVENPHLLRGLLEKDDKYTIDTKTSKVEMKKRLESTEDPEKGDCTVAKLKKQNSILIK